LIICPTLLEEPRSDSFFYSLLIADSHPLFLRDSPSLAFNIRRYSKKKATPTTAASTTSSKESLPLISSLPVTSLFEETPETAQKEQSSATTRSIIEVVEPIVHLRTKNHHMNSDIGGKKFRRTPMEMTAFRQLNADQTPNLGRCNSVY
jgi:hypothetical protein